MSLSPATNMVPGQTYTFTFSLGNWFTTPSMSTILSDVQNWGPQYADNVVANWQSNPNQLTSYNPFANYLLLTFVYKGDGSDVVADSGQEFVVAFKNGSDDNLSFQTADGGYQSGGGAPPPPDAKCSVTNLSACLPNTDLLIAGVIIVVLGLMFLSPAGQVIGTNLATRRSA